MPGPPAATRSPPERSASADAVAAVDGFRRLSPSPATPRPDGRAARLGAARAGLNVGRAWPTQDDQLFGGFGGAPKFPVAPVLGFLLDQPDRRVLALRTLKRMGASPLRDPVEGGFFRYAVHRDWSDPHYERMLYDNAQLLDLYTSRVAAHRRTVGAHRSPTASRGS